MITTNQGVSLDRKFGKVKLSQVREAVRRCRIDANYTIHPSVGRLITECRKTAKMFQRAGIPVQKEGAGYPGIGWDAGWWGLDIEIDEDI